MKEIKFRAWDLKNKWMDECFFVCSVSGVAHDTPSETYDTPNTEVEENLNLVVMQYTGLKDSKGVEIYEGDILHHKLQGNRKVIYPMSVGFAGFGLESADGKKNTLQDSERLYEIIGNIYENPELLEDK